MNEQEKTPTNQTPKVDRRLGDEWVDWDGRIQQDQIAVSFWLYVLITFFIAVFFAMSMLLVSWLIWPRLETLNVQHWFKGLLIVTGGILVTWFSLVFLNALGFTWLRWPLKRLGGIQWNMATGLWIGKLFGFSKDKIGHAYVLLHNQIEVLPRKIEDASKLLLLAPRCLSRESLEGLKNLKQRYGFSQVIAIGGSEARKGIAEVKPEGIIAIACERDLVAGIKDLHGRIPVIAFTNERPEGPCKNTTISLDSVEKTVKMFLGK